MTPQANLAVSNERPLRNSGWSAEESSLLLREVTAAGKNGTTLRQAFNRFAQMSGRKPGSVRNHYYAVLRTQHTAQSGQIINARASFQTFAPEEVESLLREVLTAQAQGISVRRCTLRLGKGDRNAMLRYQNKYRSVLRSHPELVKQVIGELRAQGISCVDPYTERPPLNRGGRPRSGDIADAELRALLRDAQTLSHVEGGSLLRALRMLLNTAARTARELDIVKKQAQSLKAGQQLLDDKLSAPQIAQMRESIFQSLLALSRDFVSAMPSGPQALQQYSDALVRHLEAYDAIEAG